MRYGRAKQARKTLQFFARQLGQGRPLQPPYHVLIDGTFAVAFTKHGLPLRERVEKLLQVNKPIIFVTTVSVLQELEMLVGKAKDEEQKATLEKARSWMQQNCSRRIGRAPKVSLRWVPENAQSQRKELSPAGNDLLAVLTDSNALDSRAESIPATGSSSSFTSTPPLFVASQDEALLHLARQSGRVPVIRLARGSVLLLDHPSQAAQTAAEQSERAKWSVQGSVPESEKKLAELVRQKERETQTQQTPHSYEQRKKRKAKGPNPLSCKKKKHTGSNKGKN